MAITGEEPGQVKDGKELGEYGNRMAEQRQREAKTGAGPHGGREADGAARGFLVEAQNTFKSYLKSAPVILVPLILNSSSFQ